MVAQPGARQTSWNAGELDGRLAGRVDIKQYYAAGLQFRNVEPVPQAGFKQMAGSVDAGPVRGRLQPLAQAGVTVTAGPHTGTETIWECDVSGTVAAVHLGSLASDSGTHSLIVEVETAAGWSQFGGITATAGTSAVARTFAVAAGQGLAGVTGVRVRATFSASASITLGTVTILSETATQDVPRYGSLKHDSGDRYNFAVSLGWMDIFLDDDFVAGLYLPTVTAAMLPSLNFYAENATIGVFHRDLWQSLRVRRVGSAALWDQDVWPVAEYPKADLGGIYVKSSDRWEIFLRWTTGDVDNLYLSIGVNGESTPAVVMKDSGGTPVGVNGTMDWDGFASAIETELEALPSLSAGVTVSHLALAGPAHMLTVSFADALAGSEYQVEPRVTNTSNISALPVHVEIGATEYEPIVSAFRGGPGVVGLVQDRLAYGDFKSVASGIGLSATAEYFDLNILSQSATAARFDKLRGGEAAERVLAFKETTHFMVFTDQGVYFAGNRTISRSDPLNYTLTSETGIVPNCDPIDLEGKVHYVGQSEEANGATGHQLVSLSYSEIDTKFEPVPESLLSSHLITDIIRSARQRSSGDSDAAKAWLLRSDGLLIAGQVIKSQDILGFCRWAAADGGLVREICIDGRNRLRICVSRGGRLRHERLDTGLFLHACITATADLAGVVSGLEIHEGRAVWAVAEGYVLGPFTVSGGAINLGDSYSGNVVVGLWSPPLWESMPRYRLLPNDEILRRPGRVHTVDIEVIDTTSIAVGANGGAVRDVPLARLGDPGNAPTPAASRKITVTGLLGSRDGTTLKISQVRPGRLTIRDLVIGEKL